MSKKKVVENRQSTLLMTAKQMSKISGIGENTLRNLMSAGEIEFLQVGSHRLLCEAAIWDFYERNKTPVKLLRPELVSRPQSAGA